MLMLLVAGLTVLTSHGNRGHLTPPLPMGVALTLGQAPAPTGSPKNKGLISWVVPRGTG